MYEADATEAVALIHEATGIKIASAYVGPVFRGPCAGHERGVL